MCVLYMVKNITHCPTFSSLSPPLGGCQGAFFSHRRRAIRALCGPPSPILKQKLVFPRKKSLPSLRPRLSLFNGFSPSSPFYYFCTQTRAAEFRQPLLRARRTSSQALALLLCRLKFFYCSNLGVLQQDFAEENLMGECNAIYK